MRPTYAELSEPRQASRPRKHAVRIIRGLIPKDLIDAYKAERWEKLGCTPQWRPGWPHPTPYMEVESMRKIALYPPLMMALQDEVGEEMGLHLCLTGFQSTERGWHSDQYLNPPFVGDRYLAAWIALGNIHPDSGPFEYALGSEQWPIISREKVWDMAHKLGLDLHQHWSTQWPTLTQEYVARACEQEILERRTTVNAFTASAGDVLIWDSDLVHRGSKPNDPNMERPALICHYSSIYARPDFPQPVQDENGQRYWPIKTNDKRYG